MTFIIVLLVLVAVVAITIVSLFNSLVKSKVNVEEAWSTITVQLKRRADLLPNLINTVKGYAAHEENVLRSVIEARSHTLSGISGGPQEAGKAETEMQGALKNLFALSEAYPDLKANTVFLNLQDEITDTENKIMASRRFYNGSVREFNTKIQQFPTSIIAQRKNFTEAEFFEVEDRKGLEEVPTVSF